MNKSVLRATGFIAVVDNLSCMRRHYFILVVQFAASALMAIVASERRAKLQPLRSSMLMMTLRLCMRPLCRDGCPEFCCCPHAPREIEAKQE